MQRQAVGARFDTGAERLAHIETVPKALSDQKVEKGRCDILLPEIVAHPRGNQYRKPEGFLQNPQVS